MAGTSALAATPTEERDWTSTTGTKLRASALGVKDAVVRFKTADGKEVLVPLAKLMPEDQSAIGAQFGKKAPTLVYPPGVSSGPHDAGGGSNYFVYIPNSLKEGRKAALLLYTGAGGGGAGSVECHQKGAEVNGWIVAASVESNNGGGLDANQAHSKRCVEHLLKTLPIDPDRVYFTGNSGGGAMAFINASTIRSAGAMPLIGYNRSRKYAKGGHYYVLGGATDFNRYYSANGAAEAGNRGFHRLYPGGHVDPPTWILDEAMTWLNGKYLLGRKSDRASNDERYDWESSVIAWIGEMKADVPYRAYYWCDFLSGAYRISGPNTEVVKALQVELGKNPINVRYAQGIEAIHGFSKKYYTEFTYSLFGHNTPKIEAAAAKFQKEWAGVPFVEDVAKELGMPTSGQ